MAGSRLKLFIVEDDALMRSTLVEQLSERPELEVVGTAESAEAALASLAKQSVDAVLVDLGLPGVPGVELIARLAERAAPPLMMAHTVFEGRDTVLAAIKAGASSYVLKGCSSQELADALFELRDGGAPMSPRIARAVLEELREPATPTEDALSPRERQVLRMLDAAMTYKDVAKELNISRHTVHSHIKHIYVQLRVNSRRAALAAARSRGLI